MVPTLGNPWFVGTLWLAEHQIVVARTLEELTMPLRLLEWYLALRGPGRSSPKVAY